MTVGLLVLVDYTVGRLYPRHTPDSGQAAVASLRMTAMRYPGGNFASGYHWMDGVGPNAKAANSYEKPAVVRAQSYGGITVKDGQAWCKLPPLSLLAMTLSAC